MTRGDDSQRSEPQAGEAVPLSPRAAAVRAVATALRGEGYVQALLADERRRGTLAARHAPLASAIALGTIRHMRQCEQILRACGAYDPRRTAPALRAIVAAGVFQLIWLDDAPAFAIVSDSVELARAAAGRRAGGMTNALLRRVQRAIVERRVPWERGSTRQVRVGWSEGCVLNCDIWPAVDNLPAHVAAASGLPPALVGRWFAAYGAAGESAAWASQFTPPLVMQRNALRMTAGQFAEAVRPRAGDDGWIGEDSVRLVDAAELGTDELIQGGGAWIQDETARAAARAVGARPGERVLDLCAAPGGKSIALAVDMEDRGEIVACDVAAERLARVDEACRRMGLRSVRTLLLAGDAGGGARGEADRRSAGDALAVEAPFDAALVDAPCSNSGVLARRPEARFRQSDRAIATLLGLQRSLLRRAAQMVRPWGRLVYSTCSIDPRENAAQVAGFVGEAPGWTLRSGETTLPSAGRRPADWRDGGFVAVLERARM